MNVKLLKDGAKVPERATSGSAGYDLCACVESPVVIHKGEIAVVPTGIAVAADENTAVMIYARSGLASKKGIALANGVGVVDSDDRGEICVALINNGKEDFVVENGMRIAQMVITPVIVEDMTVTDTLPDTERGEGGFGSTGVNTK